MMRNLIRELHYAWADGIAKRDLTPEEYERRKSNGEISTLGLVPFKEGYHAGQSAERLKVREVIPEPTEDEIEAALQAYIAAGSVPGFSRLMAKYFFKSGAHWALGRMK